jgi:hypothetical protein
MAWAAKTSVLAGVAAVAVLLAGCWQSYQEFADGCADAPVDVVIEADADVVPDPDVRADADVGSEADSEADERADADVVDGDEVPDGGLVPCAGGLYDPASGLCWEDPPDDVWGMNWSDAVAHCGALSLGGYGPGSWHLPTISELRSLIRGCAETVTGGACGVTDSCLDGTCLSSPCGECSHLGGPGEGGCYWDAALGGACDWYWSSSSYAGGVSNAWYVYFGGGGVNFLNRTHAFYVRCVRRGP